MNHKTDPNESAFPHNCHPGLTKREWFAGQFATSGTYNEAGCIALADDLIAALNANMNWEKAE